MAFSYYDLKQDTNKKKKITNPFFVNIIVKNINKLNPRVNEFLNTLL